MESGDKFPDGPFVSIGANIRMVERAAKSDDEKPSRAFRYVSGGDWQAIASPVYLDHFATGEHIYVPILLHNDSDETVPEWSASLERRIPDGSSAYPVRARAPSVPPRSIGALNIAFANPKPGYLPQFTFAVRFRDSTGQLWEKIEDKAVEKCHDGASLMFDN